MTKHAINSPISVNLSRAELDGLIRLAQAGLHYLEKDPVTSRSYLGLPAQEKAARSGLAALKASRGSIGK